MVAAESKVKPQVSLKMLHDLEDSLKVAQRRSFWFLNERGQRLKENRIKELRSALRGMFKSMSDLDALSYVQFGFQRRARQIYGVDLSEEIGQIDIQTEITRPMRLISGRVEDVSPLLVVYRVEDSVRNRSVARAIVDKIAASLDTTLKVPS